MSRADSTLMLLTEKLKKKFKWVRELEEDQPVILSTLLFVFLLASWLTGLPFSERTGDAYEMMYELPLKIVRYCIYIFCIFVIGMNFLIGYYKFWHLFIICLVGLATFLICRSSEFFIWFLLIMAEAPSDFRRILKVYAICQGFILLFIPFLSSFGLLSNVMFDADRLRQGMGFTWTTTAPMMLFFFILTIYKIQNTKMSSFTVYLFALSVLWLYFLTNTRMVFLCSLLFLVLILLTNKWPRWFDFTEQRWFYYVLVILPLFLAMLSFVLVMFYDQNNAIFKILNKVLSGRLSLTQKAVQRYGIHLLGENIEWMGHGLETVRASKYIYVDISYMNILINFGVIVLGGVIYFYSKLLAVSWRRKDRPMMMIIVFILLLSFIEVRLINPLYNPFILLFGNLALKDKFKTSVFKPALEKSSKQL